MIDQVDDRLKEWVGTAVGPVAVSLALPNGSRPGTGVNLYLVELALKPLVRRRGHSAQQLTLRYLVTTWAEQPEDAHRLLGDLVFAAMEASDFEVELAGASTELWHALGTPPRPSFMLAVPLEKLRPAEQVPRVLKPVVIEVAPVESFHGLVLGPGDVPLAAARVRMETLGLETRTDGAGRFLFSSVPGGGRPKSLVAQAHGVETAATTTSQHPAAGDPFVLRFESMED
ncbi:MAG: carboxypeptidase regulatory-like domain-containing protein [Acidobacteriota bacterium]